MLTYIILVGYFSFKKCYFVLIRKLNFVICRTMNSLGEQYANWNKSEGVRQIQYNLYVHYSEYNKKEVDS